MRAVHRIVLPLPLLASASCLLPAPEHDVELGRGVAAAMEEQIGRFDDGQIADYVEGVGRRLEARLQETPFRYRFALLDQPEPNAFAAPGGFVYVSRGLLALANSEDELAGVIGHEIVHVEQRHTARQMARQRLPNLLSLPGRAIGAVISTDLGRLINSPISGLGALTMARHGRGQESESDRLGQALCANTGYDPSALGDVLERMERFVETLTGVQHKPSFFDTHPPTPTRVSEARARARELTAAPRPATALSDEAFLQRLDGLVYGPNPAQGEFRGATFLHPDLGVALEFPAGWNTINTAQMAAAVAPDKDAVVVYGVAGDVGATDVASLAAKRRQQLEDDQGLRPSRDESLEIGGRNAYLLAYSEGSGSDAIHLFFVWIEAEGVLHRLVGMAPEPMRQTVKQVVESLRALTATERDSFTVARLAVIAARAGETLTALGTRANSALDTATTATLNGVAPDAPLAAGALIKIVVVEPYRPSR